MTSIWVDDELGVRNVAGEQVRVHSGHHDVVVAIRHESGLGYSCQSCELTHVGDAPIGYRFCMSVSYGKGGIVVAVLHAGKDPTEELCAFRHAGLRWREEEIEGVIGTLNISVCPLGGLAFPDVKAAPALWAGSTEDKAAHQTRPSKGDVLGDKSAHGEPEQIHLRETQFVDELQDVAGKSFNSVRA